MRYLLEKAGNYVLAYIYENIQKGVDAKGNPFAYSKRPFYRPYNQALYKKMGGASGYGKLFTITQSKGGRLGFIIMGYDAFKQAVYPGSYGSFLTVTGKLLRSMKVTSVNDSRAVIGFTGTRNQLIATYLNETGAGRGRKLWQFLGIRPEQFVDLNKQLSPEANEYYKGLLGEIVRRLDTTR